MSQQITKFIQDQAIAAVKLANTAVSPGSYTNSNITVDQQGRITAAASGTASSVFAYRSVTTTDTCTTSDYTLNLSGSSFTQTLYTASGNAGRVLVIKHNGTSLTQVYTLATTGGQTIGGVASGSYALYTNGESLTLQSDGSNWIILDHYAKTPWTNFSNVSAGTFITATTTAPTFGTVSHNVAQWMRDGKNIKFRWDFRQTALGSAAAGSGSYLINLISGLTIDTSLAVGNTNTGVLASESGSVGRAAMSNAGDSSVGTVSVYDSTRLKVNALTSGGGSGGTRGEWGSSFYNFAGATVLCSISAEIPISGWQP